MGCSLAKPFETVGSQGHGPSTGSSIRMSLMCCQKAGPAPTPGIQGMGRGREGSEWDSDLPLPVTIPQPGLGHITQLVTTGTVSRGAFPRGLVSLCQRMSSVDRIHA